jgi:chitodextrinase
LIQNPANEGWVNYILQTEKVALEQFGFDGWHIDQLGDRGNLYDYNGNFVAFDKAFGSMLRKIKDRLKTRIVMNAVSEYGVEQIAAAPVDVLYTEVWPDTAYGSFTADKTYNQLKNHVETGLRLGKGKQGQVLAAYMNYQAAERPGFFNTPAILLTDAVIMAAGGTHLELGDTGMLGKEYFPNKNLQMTPELDERLKRYYDFQTAYQNMLMDGVKPIDVPVTAMNGGVVTSTPQAGAVWSFARQAEGSQVVHLLNLSNNVTNNWRDDYANNVTMPSKKTNFKVQLKTSVWPEKVYFVTADGDLRMQEIAHVVSGGADGKYVVEVTVPELTLWSSLVLKETGVKLGLSAWVSTKTASAPVLEVDKVAPTIPVGLKASSITTSGFRLAWSPATDNVGVTGYNVYRNGAYVFSVSQSSAVFSGLAPNSVYKVQVLAYDVRMNKSARSAELTVKTLALPDKTAPSVPNGLVASNVTKSGFRVTWNASSDNVGVTGYNVYRNGVYILTVAGRTVTWSGLKANTVYKVQVLAFDKVMNKSVRSAELSVKTLP